MQTTKTNAKRRRESNRYAQCSYPRRTVGTSFGQPLPVNYYLNRIMNTDGTVNRELIIQSFNSEQYA